MTMVAPPVNGDARSVVRSYLESIGLGTETDWYLNEKVLGRSDSAIQFDLQQRQAFKTRFPGFDQLQKEGRAITVPQWLAYESQARQVFRSEGVPTEVLNAMGPADWSKYILNNISVQELQQRVQLNKQSLAGQYNLEEARLYGISEGDLLAYEYLDPGKSLPLLQKRFEAAQAATLSQRAGYGQLNTAEAEQVGRANLSTAQETQGFTGLAANRELYASLDQGEQAITRQSQLGATFEGNAAAQQEIQARQRRRQAAFSGGGDFASSQQGFTGAR